MTLTLLKALPLLSWLITQSPQSEPPFKIVPREVGVPIGQGTKAPTLTLEAPLGGWTVDRMLHIKGRVSDKTIDPVTISINGDRYLLRTLNGAFDRQFPAAFGKNVVTVEGKNHGGTGRQQVTCYSQVPPVPLKLILTSDSDGVYTDLHIYEPTQASEPRPGAIDFGKMAHVFWANTASPSGGTFYLNEQGGNFDQPGYGPYLYVHRAPPQGLYIVTTNYWPSGDRAHTLATLNIVLYEGTANELKRKVQIPLATQGTTKALALIRLGANNRTELYIPGQDLPPQGEGWPQDLPRLIRAAELAKD